MAYKCVEILLLVKAVQTVTKCINIWHNCHHMQMQTTSFLATLFKYRKILGLQLNEIEMGLYQIHKMDMM